MSASLARATALLAALAVAAPALAEERGQAGEKARIGVGVSLTTFDLATPSAGSPVAAPADVYVSVDVGQLRIEPSLGINSYSIDGGNKARSINLGVGAFIHLRSTRAVAISVGPRLFLDFVNAKNAAGFSDSGTDLTLAAAMGAEWFPDPRFSLGAEARLGFTTAGQLSNGGTILRPASTRYGTSGLFFLRFYP
jgi:hypothetical protein